MRTQQQIKALLESGLSYRNIADLTGVPHATLVRWVHTPPNYAKYIESIDQVHNNKFKVKK